MPEKNEMSLAWHKCS